MGEITASKGVVYCCHTTSRQKAMMIVALDLHTKGRLVKFIFSSLQGRFPVMPTTALSQAFIGANRNARVELSVATNVVTLPGPTIADQMQD